MREGRASDAKPLAVLLVSHDARRGGAQRCLLELAHVLKNELGRHVELATCADGDLLPEFERIAPVARLHGGDGDIRAAANVLVSEFKRRWPNGLIVVNTSSIADVYRALDDQSVRNALAWIHELPASIEDHYGGAATVALIERVVRQIVVPCDLARDAIRARYDVPASKIAALSNGVARSIVRGVDEIDRAGARQSLRELTGANPDALVVLGCGIGDRRKGVDLFGMVADEVCRRAAGLPVHFVWLGKEVESDVRTLAWQAVEAGGFADRLHFVGPSEAPELYYAGADLFLITSRVDPSPLVNAEAMIFGLPVIFFEDGGGAREQQPLEVELGVAGFDTHAMATRVLDLLRDDGKRHELGRLLGQHARRSFSWSKFAERLDRIGLDPTPDVRATADRVVKKHGFRGALVPPERRLLLILPDIEIGGGQLNAIRLANALTATHQVFMLNARPELYDRSVAELISPDVIPLEGSLHRTPWYDHADPWTKDAHYTDERPHRVRVVAELLKHFQIGTVLSQVWWSDRFALALHDLADFDWFVKFCGCYELLLRQPLMDPSFVPKARRILRSVTGVTYGAETNLQLLEDPRFPRPPAARRIFNGFSRALIDRPSGQSPPRSPGDFVFCICSRAIQDKGWEEAVLAVAQINRRPAADRGGKRARLWLIGDGPALATLKSRYAGEEDVVFLGQRTRPHSIMAAADAGLLPSYAESQPTAVIESLACGRPVVATAVGAIPQMLAHDHRHAGILVPPLPNAQGVAVEALADAMLRYMVDEGIYREHQEAAGRVFDAQFDMSATVHNYLSFFAEAQSARRAVRALPVLGAAVDSLRRTTHRRRTEARAARLVGGMSRALAFLLLVDVFVLPLLLVPEAGIGGRLLLFTLGILTAHAALRWDAVALAALVLSGFGLAADGLVRTLIALNVSGVAVNGPEAERGLNGRRPGAPFEWTGQVGLPREFRTVGRWNRWGFNDRDPPTTSTSSDPIVLILGDSYVEGLQVPESAVFFRVAEERLRADGHPVRMVGLGESGSGACAAADRLEALSRLLGPLRPAVVVYAFVYNDVRNDYAPWTQDGIAIEAQLPAFLSRPFSTRVPSLDLLRFHLRQRARALIAAYRSRQRINPDSLMFADDTVGDVGAAWQATLGCVDRMARWTGARGSAFATLELPPGSPLYTRSACEQLAARGNACDSERPRRRLAEHAGGNHQAFLTPVDDFRNAWLRNEPLQFRWDGHYNEAGHRLVGQFLASRLPSLLR